MSLIIKMAKTYRANQLSRDKILKLQDARFQKLVSYARNHSPFYQKLYENLDDSFRLTDLPPVTKAQMMESFDDVLTDGSITMEKINAFTDDLDNIGRKIDGKYLVFKTSGSTGIPAVVLYDDSSIDVSSAIAACRAFARKEDLKSFLKHGKKTAGVFADNGFYLACGMSRYLQLKMPYQKTKITVDVNSPNQEIVKKLNAFGTSMLNGYPANLALLADMDGLNIHPDVIITGGELLTDSTRNKLEQRFGCYVQTHYSCTEGSEIACECSERHLHINEDWIIVEPVDKDYHSVPNGVMSDKVLITNLANFIQPFIRYELTDRVIVHDEGCPCGNPSYWVEIEGRTDDILKLETDISVAPMSLYKILEEVPGIRRFQLIQKTKNCLELRIDANHRTEAFQNANTALQEFFLQKGIKDVQIRLSDQAPMPDTSGKFKHIYKEEF